MGWWKAMSGKNMFNHNEHDGHNEIVLKKTEGFLPRKSVEGSLFSKMFLVVFVVPVVVKRILS